MKWKLVSASFLLVMLVCAASIAATPASRGRGVQGKLSTGTGASAYFLQPGDVVLFLGNSITAGAQAELNFLTEDIKKRYPELAGGEGQVKFVISGVGGEQAQGGAGRLKAAIRQQKFSVCVVCYGTCEITFDNEKSFVPAMKDIVKQLKDAGVAVTIVAPPPSTTGKWRDGMPEMVNRARKVAAEEGVLFVDAHAALSGYFDKSKKPFTTDGIHLNQDGYRVMADALQEAWGFGQPAAKAGSPRPGPAAAAADGTTKLAAAGGETSTKGKPEVWILSGQSNACGKANPVPPLPADPRVEIFDPQKESWVPAQEPLPGMRHESPGPSKGLGPWHAAALEVVGKTGGNIRLTGTGCDGRPISFWAEGQPGWTVLSDRIRKAGKGADVFLWFQGESDGLANSRTYPEDLKKFVARVRAAAENPKMTVVVIQIGPLGMDNPCGYAAIREVQRRFVIEDGNALLVPAVGRKAADPYHPTREGYIELGKEIGRALLRMRHGAKDVDWPGPVLDAAVLGADGRTVTAHFAEVKKLGGCLAADFAVAEPDGTAKVRMLPAKAEAGATVVRLTFAEAVKLPAALAYALGNHPRATLVDEAGNRAPAVQMEIVQGKPPEDKPSAASNGAGAVPGGGGRTAGQ